MRTLRGVWMLVVLGWCVAGWTQITVPPVTGVQAPPTLLVLRPDVESPFNNQESVQNELYGLFVFDLQFSGAFNVVEENTQAAFLKRQDNERGDTNLDYGAWNQLKFGSENLAYVMKVMLVPRGSGYMQFNLLVFDVQQGQRVIATAYGQNPPFQLKDLRRAGHKATGEIITTLTNDLIKPITESRILFVNHNTTQRTKELYVMDYDGWEKSIQQLTFFKSVTLFPDWSPDGNEVAYVSFKDGWPDAFVQNLVTGKVSGLARFLGTNNTPRWFPDGERLAISLSAQGNPEIYIIPRSGLKPQRITNNLAIDQAPDVAPDTSRIAFISDRVGSPQVYVMNPDGSNTRRISFIERKCDTPTWSPIKVDEDYRISFTGYFNSLDADVFTVKPDGTGDRNLTEGLGGDNKNATWSPNGQYLVFSSNHLKKHEIFIISSEYGRLLPNGKRVHRLTYLPGDNLSPVWSPQ